jgi:hypothetical protein
MSWLTYVTAKPGSRKNDIESARLGDNEFARYEDRWDLLSYSALDAPVMLEEWMRYAIDDPAIGLPDGHRWQDRLPVFLPAATDQAR